MKKIGLTTLLVSMIWIGILAYTCGLNYERGVIKGAAKVEDVRLAVSQTRFNHHRNNVIAGADFIEAALEVATRIGDQVDQPIDAKIFQLALDLHLDAYLQSYETSYVTGSQIGHTILGQADGGTFRIFRHRGFSRSFPIGTPAKTVILSLVEYAKGLPLKNAE